jgi:hypothetical protein
VHQNPGTRDGYSARSRASPRSARDAEPNRRAPSRRWWRSFATSSRPPRSGSSGPRFPASSAAPFRRGCREKPFEKARSTLAEVHLRAAVRDALATDGLVRRARWPFSEPTLTSDPAGSPGVFPTVTDNSSTGKGPLACRRTPAARPPAHLQRACRDASSSMNEPLPACQLGEVSSATRKCRSVNAEMCRSTAARNRPGHC